MPNHTLAHALATLALLFSAVGAGTARALDGSTVAAEFDLSQLYRLEDFARDYGHRYDPELLVEELSDSYAPGAWQLSYTARAGDDLALTWLLGVSGHGGSLPDYLFSTLSETYDTDPKWKRRPGKQLDRWFDGARGYSLAELGGRDLHGVLVRSGRHYVALVSTGFGSPSAAMEKLAPRLDRLFALEPRPGPATPYSNPYLTIFEYEDMIGASLWSPEVEQSSDYSFENPGGGMFYDASAPGRGLLSWSILPREGKSFDEIVAENLGDLAALEAEGLRVIPGQEDWNNGSLMINAGAGRPVAAFLTVVGDHFALFLSEHEAGFGSPKEVRRRFDPILARVPAGPLQPTAAQLLAQGFSESSFARTAVSEYYYSLDGLPASASDIGLEPISTGYLDIDIVSGGTILVDFHHAALRGRVAMTPEIAGGVIERFSCRTDVPSMIAPSSCTQAEPGALASLGTSAAPPDSPAETLAAKPKPNPRTITDGLNVARVEYENGWFAMTADGRWAEYRADGKARFWFEETGRTQLFVDLNDPSRNVQIELDFNVAMIRYGTNGGPKYDLYKMTRIYQSP